MLIRKHNRSAIDQMSRYNTISIASSGNGVLRITINHEDLAKVLDTLEGNEEVKVVIFSSGNPDYFIAHYDLRPWCKAPPAQIQQQKLFNNIFFKISNEFILHCHMRFEAKAKTKLTQPEVSHGIVPGAGGIDYLYIFTGQDVDTDTAERLGWVNGALEADKLKNHVSRVATRIAGFSSKALAGVKDRINTRSHPDDAEILKDAQVLAGLMGQYQQKASQRL
ncbi:ClpP/crotonase-like domain-containing protein [Dactylonectria macrodidyma]|uniref:ClpP/crotonase-like domain-containing protein n=1 Tax=Dactylonectria macrodidyma TaxID=307937 RepID=A0A9P9ERC3_9HYPO|nr:ClpP/crotonase-like domain-containing protein [Dactylonectria macrodidyma]